MNKGILASAAFATLFTQAGASEGGISSIESRLPQDAFKIVDAARGRLHECDPQFKNAEPQGDENKAELGIQINPNASSAVELCTQEVIEDLQRELAALKNQCSIGAVSTVDGILIEAECPENIPPQVSCEVNVA